MGNTDLVWLVEIAFIYGGISAFMLVTRRDARDLANRVEVGASQVKIIDTNPDPAVHPCQRGHGALVERYRDPFDDQITAGLLLIDFKLQQTLRIVKTLFQFFVTAAGDHAYCGILKVLTGDQDTALFQLPLTVIDFEDSY